MGAIYLIRHGQASFGAEDYDQLSPLGYEQGRVLGRWFRQCGLVFDQVVAGSLRRHVQTAESCLETMDDSGGAVHTDPGFDEYDHHEMLVRHEPAFANPQAAGELLQGHDSPRKAFQDIFVRAFTRWSGGSHDSEYRESWPAFRNRCVAALDRLVNAAPRATRIAVFTSGGPITAITHQLLGTSEDRLPDLNSGIVNSSVTKLLFQPGRVSLNYLNNHAHLEAAGDQTLITYR